jgi:glycosyltransferase 2 family protein
MPMRKRHWLLLAGCLVSAAFLAAVLWRLDWPVFLAEMRRVNLPLLVLAIVAIGLSIALRALRWNLAAGVPLRAYGAFWNAAVIGLAFNHIYPLRAGEVARIFMLNQMAAVPLGRAATSALIDRLADVLLLGVGALLVAGAHAGLPYAEGLAGGTLALACAAIAALVIFGKGDHVWRGWFGQWAARVPERLRGRLQGLYAGAVETSALIASPLQLVRIVAITAAAFALDCAAVFCALEAFGWELPLVASLTVLVFLALGTSLPSAPGFAGVYQVACVLALALFGIGESAAVAYSIVFQLCLLATVIPLAALAAASHRAEFRSARSALVR